MKLFLRSPLVPRFTRGPLWLFLFLLVAACAYAQDSYELQVFPSATIRPGDSEVNLHSNFVADGSRAEADGVYPNNHLEHETLEFTRGVTPWFDIAGYLFTTVSKSHGWDWVGNHIRGQVRAPEEWHWPVGVGFSADIGYQRPGYSPDQWTLELRPIIDKKLGRWYASFNPTFDRSLHGLNQNRGFEFSPNGKVSYDISKKLAGGVEYYGHAGPVTGLDDFREQIHQIFPTVDLKVNPRWEVNFGVGVGVTPSTDHLVIKSIVRRHFGKTPAVEAQDDSLPFHSPKRVAGRITE
jgi:hypothetical protein